MKKHFFICLLVFFSVTTRANTASSYLIVLGVAQDGGYPHMGCEKECCRKAWANPALGANVVSLALVDPASKKWWLLEATPDIKQQLKTFQNQTNRQYPYLPEGVFLSHAHIGHYTGLMEFGREVMATKSLKVYVLPRFRAFLEKNGPWSQLVNLKNIELVTLLPETAVALPNSTITAFTVPHRDEFSETAGFRISTGAKKYLFIPDIDKWSKWDKQIADEVRQADIALLDATFYTATELGNRPIAEVPHPLVTETMALFEHAPQATRKKVYFIHFNHTNPLLWDLTAQKKIKEKGFCLARQGQVL